MASRNLEGKAGHICSFCPLPPPQSSPSSWYESGEEEDKDDEDEKEMGLGLHLLEALICLDLLLPVLR